MVASRDVHMGDGGSVEPRRGEGVVGFAVANYRDAGWLVVGIKKERLRLERPETWMATGKRK